ncbi:MAG TPA: hypothetical protein VGR02_04340 [Thermoanaerobaculia bacterium]|jgi:hypothetical protein|nr:hypothetical protein [Thermoanaerobaculia bacterium]
MQFTEDHVPVEGIQQTIHELVELYGGERTGSGEREERFTLPLRRGVAIGGGVECTVAWAPSVDPETTVTLTCDRDVDAPRAQRVAMLVAGVIGGLLFTIWPFFPHQKEFGTLGWMGGLVAVCVYFLSLRKTSGGIAWDFLQRVVRTQRNGALPAE